MLSWCNNGSAKSYRKRILTATQVLGRTIPSLVPAVQAHPASRLLIAVCRAASMAFQTNLIASLRTRFVICSTSKIALTKSLCVSEEEKEEDHAEQKENEVEDEDVAE